MRQLYKIHMRQQEDFRFSRSHHRVRDCVTCPFKAGQVGHTRSSCSVSACRPKLFAWPCKTALMGVFPDPGTSNETRTFSKGFVGRRTSRLASLEGMYSLVQHTRKHTCVFIHPHTRKHSRPRIVPHSESRSPMHGLLCTGTRQKATW